MAREICLFDKFSFCKNGDNCRRLHLKEVCLIRGCDYRKCEKRHPNPCKTFMLKGFCRFGTACKYSHRISKETEEQNKKIESLEEVTKKLSKQVAEQNDEIKALKRELLETESRELERLQKQIDSLVKSNDEKEKAIMTVDEEHLMEQEVNEDVVHVSVEEAVLTEESFEAEEIKKATIEESEDIVFETLITSRKKKWAMKDRTFAECIVEKYELNMENLDWFEEDEGDCLEDLMKSHFLSSAELLEEEAKERKITNKELKAAVEFFKIIVNRPDFTNQKFKQILKQGRKFIDEEMKKVMSV